MSNESHKHVITDQRKYKKVQIKKWRNKEYHIQHDNVAKHQDVKMYCVKNQFSGLHFIGPHNKPHGIHGLGNNYHMHFDNIIGHGTCAICRIHCSCTSCISIIGQPWVPGIPAHQEPRYQTIQDCTYWHVLGSVNNCKILQLSHKATSTK